MSPRPLVQSLILSLSIVIAAAVLGRSLTAFKRLDQSVEVRGLAERIVESDQASWSLSYSISGEQLAELNTKAQTTQSAITEFLKTNGFDDSEIMRQPLTIQDKLTNEYNTSRGPRFVARTSIVISTPKIAQVGTVAQKTDELVKRGVALSASTVRYMFTNLNSIKPAMLVEATQNARDAAQSFASTTGASLGGIKSAQQGLFSIGSPNADYDDGASVMKKVRVVTQVRFYLE